VLIVTPYPLNPNNSEHIRQLHVYNKVSEIAEEYGITYINYNFLYDEIGIDFETDFADGVHLNYKGNPKFTSYLGAWIKANYEIPDRRENGNYDDYYVMAKDCQMKIYDQELRDIKDLDEWMRKSQNEEYLLVYTVSGNYKATENYDKVKVLLSSCGIDLDMVDGNSAWVTEKGEVVFASGNDVGYCWHKDIGKTDYLTVKDVNSSSNGNNSPPVIDFNNTVFQPVTDGITIFVYDTFTQTEVETAGFEIKDNMINYKKVS